MRERVGEEIEKAEQRNATYPPHELEPELTVSGYSIRVLRGGSGTWKTDKSVDFLLV